MINSIPDTKSVGTATSILRSMREACGTTKDEFSRRFQSAVRLWLLQRISAVLVFVLLGLHVWTVHYVELGQPILFTGVALRLKSVLSLIIDSSLLLIGLFHGLNGVRMVLLDFGALTKFEKLISRTICIIGIIFFIWGVRGLWAFLAIR